MKTVRVYHDYYGCDTGCCGHTVEVDGVRHFEFDHNGGEMSELEYAKALAAYAFGKEHCQDLDWDNAEIELSDD